VTRRARWTATRPAAVALAVVLLAGCGLGNDVRTFLADTYAVVTEDGSTTTYAAPTPVPETADRIGDAVLPAARAADDGEEYLRYDEGIVVVSPGGGGSSVRVEDLDGPYSDGAYAHLGPGFDPGSPQGAVEEDDVK
jgi:hypothetical protein